MALLNWDIKLTEVIILSLTQKDKQILTHFFRSQKIRITRLRLGEQNKKMECLCLKRKIFHNFKKIWFLWSEHSPVQDEIRKMIQALYFEKKNERKR